MKADKFRNMSKKILIVFFRLLLILLVMEFSLRISGYARESYMSKSNEIIHSSASDYKILVLGDSVTMGDGPGWSSELNYALKSKAPKISFSVFVEAKPAQISENYMSNLEGWLNSYQPTIVAAMIGANDPGPALQNNQQSLPQIDNVKTTATIKKLKEFRVYKLSNYAWKYFTNRMYDLYFKYFKAHSLNENKLSTEVTTEITPEVLVEQGRNYFAKSDFKKAEEMFKKALEKDPINSNASLGLARIYMVIDGRNDDLNRFNTLSATNSVEGAFIEIAWDYLIQGKNDDAERIFNIVNNLGPTKLIGVYGEIVDHYRKTGNDWNSEIVKEYSSRIGEIRNLNINPYTKANYQKIYEILNKRNVRLIAVQYPTLSVESLKIMFDKNEDILFVSNEENFKKEIETNGYFSVFRERFFGSFGHLTSKGADMVAENVANAILEDLKIAQTT